MRTLLLLALIGCVQQRSARCKQVCARESECVASTSSSIPFDEKECIAACAALEHDVQHSAAKVAHHVDCVTRQRACAGVLECK